MEKTLDLPVDCDFLPGFLLAPATVKALKVERTSRPVEFDDETWTCIVCGQDCRDAFGGASKPCRMEYNYD